MTKNNDNKKQNESSNNGESKTNSSDPKLKFDAFTGGMKEGGLRSVSSINMLVCYLIANIDSRVTAENIVRTVDEGMIANHFEISEAIARLKASGTIIESEDGALSLKNNEKADIDLIEKDLPLTIREKSIKICQKIIAKETYSRENKAQITKCNNGYTVTLTVSDKDNDFLTLSIFAATIDQAQMIKEKFISDPVAVYERLIDFIFENEQ